MCVCVAVEAGRSPNALTRRNFVDLLTLQMKDGGTKIKAKLAAFWPKHGADPLL